MNNPWLDLPEKPVNGEYVLPKDKPYIDAFNARNSKEKHKDKHEIQLHITPEPWHGPTNATVYLLLANPSCEPDKTRAPEELVAEIKNVNAPHRGALQENRDTWWGKRLKSLLNNNVSEDDISRNLCSVDYFPYRSKNFGHTHIRLPSQAYTFHKVSEAAKRGALLLIMRCYKQWVGAVPELTQNSDNIIRPKSPQCSYLTPNNLDPEESFNRLVEALRH